MTKIRLYPYQREGVSWIVRNGGGFLWDEPGLGKTVQAICAANELAPHEPILVVCPNSLKLWWQKEIEHVLGEPSYVSESGGWFPLGIDIATADLDPQVRWYIIHYTGLAIQAKRGFTEKPWGAVILDECHYIKNRKAQRTQAVWKVTPPTAAKIGLTATPYSKDAAELWSQLVWYAPQLPALRSYWSFFKRFNLYAECTNGNGRRYYKVVGIKEPRVLAEFMSAFGLRRSKEVVSPDLPPLTETEMPLPLEGRQLEIYRALLRRTAVEIRSLSGKSRQIVVSNVLARLNHLQQVLSCPWDYDEKVTGTKLDWLCTWAEEENRPAVVLTAFKASARRVAKELDTEAITGDVKPAEREKIVSAWKRGERQFLVGTIHTMGTGLNLQEAHTLVFYDQVWSNILMAQARERIHRINTDHPVQVIYLYVPRTTNETVLRAFQDKMSQLELVQTWLETLQLMEVLPA